MANDDEHHEQPASGAKRIGPEDLFRSWMWMLAVVSWLLNEPTVETSIALGVGTIIVSSTLLISILSPVALFLTGFVMTAYPVLGILLAIESTLGIFAHKVLKKSPSTSALRHKYLLGIWTITLSQFGWLIWWVTVSLPFGLQIDNAEFFAFAFDSTLLLVCGLWLYEAWWLWRHRSA